VLFVNLLSLLSPYDFTLFLAFYKEEPLKMPNLSVFLHSFPVSRKQQHIVIIFIPLHNILFFLIDIPLFLYYNNKTAVNLKTMIILGRN